MICCATLQKIMAQLIKLAQECLFLQLGHKHCSHTVRHAFDTKWYCLVPIFSYQCSFFKIDDEIDFPTLHVLCYIINWSSVVMNPAIYVATQPKYRMAIKMLVIRIQYLTQPEEARRLVIQLDSEYKLAKCTKSVGAGRGRDPHHMPESYTEDSSDRLK